MALDIPVWKSIPLLPDEKLAPALAQIGDALAANIENPGQLRQHLCKINPTNQAQGAQATHTQLNEAGITGTGRPALILSSRVAGTAIDEPPEADVLAQVLIDTLAVPELAAHRAHAVLTTSLDTTTVPATHRAQVGWYTLIDERIRAVAPLIQPAFTWIPARTPPANNDQLLGGGGAKGGGAHGGGANGGGANGGDTNNADGAGANNNAAGAGNHAAGGGANNNIIYVYVCTLRRKRFGSGRKAPSIDSMLASGPDRGPPSNRSSKGRAFGNTRWGEPHTQWIGWHAAWDRVPATDTPCFAEI